MKISVIVPCYNVEKELERCVDSILAQDIKSMEIILIDDGATDNTPQICDRLQELYPKVKTIHQANGGLSDARNTGLDNAKGEYVAFVDSDDYLQSNIYKNVLKKMENHNADVGIFNVVRVFKDREEVQDSFNRYCHNSDEILESLFKYKGINFYAWNKIIKRSILEGIYYEKGTMYEDIMFSFKMSNRADSAIITDEVGYNYMDNDDSIVNQKFNPKQYDNVNERMKLYGAVKRINPSLENLALDKLVDGFLSTGFKLASSDYSNLETKKYIRLLREEIGVYFETIQNNSTIILPKKIALALLKLNLPVYKILYKLYLNK